MLTKTQLQSRLSEIDNLLPESAMAIEVACRYGAQAELNEKIVRAKELLAELRAELE